MRFGPRLEAAVALLLLLSALPCRAQQVPDTAYAPPTVVPEYAFGTGPRVRIDAAHLNFHTAEGSYQAFATLLGRAGYRVESNHGPFTRATLRGVDVVVVANAMHRQSRDEWAPLPNLSAFSDEEIEEVEAWVREGGSLLLIADHMPLAGHSEALAAVFGIRFMNGFAVERGTQGGRLTFRRADGSLPTSMVADGRGPDEQVDSVTTFTGQAFRVDPQVSAQPLLVLPQGIDVLLPTVAWEFSESTPRVSGTNLLQGVLVRHGQGRVAAFAEAAMFSAQLAGPRQVPAGMNHPAAGQNYRFALNLMLWLNGRL